MDGVITFYSSIHVFKAEKKLKLEGLEVMLIPGPREISPNCGTALCFDYDKKEEAGQILNKEKIVFEKIHFYPEAKKISKWIS